MTIEIIKKLTRKPKAPADEYVFRSSRSSMRNSYLMLPKNMVENIDDVYREYMADKTWKRTDGALVRPGFRFIIVGRMAEIVHKLVSIDGFRKFRIKECTVSAKSFKTASNFEVPYFHLIVDRMVTVERGSKD